MTSKLWAEIWTRPGDANYGRLVDDPLEVEGDFHDGLNQIGNGGMQLSNRSPYFDDILVSDPDTPANAKSSTVKIFSEKDPTTPIFEWLPNQLFPETSKNDPLVQVSGLGIKAMLAHARLEPYDWDGSDDWACTACDWSFGGTQILQNGGFETVPFPNGGFEDGTNDYWGVTAADGFITNGQALVAVKDAAAAQAGDWYGFVNPGVAKSGAVRSFSGLVLGQTYTITGWMLDPTASGDRWRAGVTGAVTATHTNAYEEDGYWWAEVGNAAMGAGASTGAWQSFTITFEAGEEQTQLVIIFDDAGSGPDFRLDSWSMTGDGIGLYPWTARYPDRTNVFDYQTSIVRSGVGAVEVQGDDLMYTAPSGKQGYGRIGIQQPATLTVGAPYVASVWVRQDSGSDQTFQMAIIRQSPLGAVGSPGSSYMAADVEVVPTGTWTKLSVAFTADVIEVNFYVSWMFTGAFDGNLHASPTYYVDDAVLFEGLPETTVGDMLTQIYNHAINPDLRSPIVWDDGSATDTPYLTLDFDESVDSAGNAWDRPEIATKLTMRMSYSQIMAHFARDYDYEYRIVADDVEAGTYLWQVYNPGTMQTDYSAAASPGIQGGAFDVRRNVNRFLPAGTDTVVEGLGRVTARARNTALMSALGRIETARLSRESPDLTAAAEAADESIAALLTNSRSLNYTLVDPPDEPMSDYVIGDLLVVDDPPEVIASPARFVDVTCSFTPNTTEWETQFGSARIINPDAAVASAVGGLLAKFEYPFPDTASPTVFEGGGGGEITLAIAAYNATDFSKSKADYVCTGVNDQTVINAALDQLDDIDGTDTAAGRLMFSEGDFHITVDQWGIHFSGSSGQKAFEFVGVGSSGGGHSTRFVLDASGGTAPNRLINAAQMSNLTVNNIAFDANGNGASCSAILLLFSGSMRVYDCWFSGFEAGVTSGSNTGSWIINNIFVGNQLDIGMTAGSVIVGNRCTNTTGTADDQPSIRVAGGSTPASGAIAAHNTITGADGYGIVATGYCHVHHNTISGSGDSGILVPSRGPVIESNTINNAGFYGIEVEFTNVALGGRIAGNVIAYPQRHGIFVDQPDWHIYDNWILVPGLATDDTYDGIHIDHDRARVMRNTVVPADDIGNTGVTRYGINVAAGTGSIVVSNVLNAAADYGTGAYNDSGTSTVNTFPAGAIGDNFST